AVMDATCGTANSVSRYLCNCILRSRTNPLWLWSTTNLKCLSGSGGKLQGRVRACAQHEVSGTCNFSPSLQVVSLERCAHLRMKFSKISEASVLHSDSKNNDLQSIVKRP